MTTHMSLGRADIAAILNIPVWDVVKFSSPRFPFGIVPSHNQTRKRNTYSIEDVYKIALAHRLAAAGLTSHAVGDVLSVIAAEPFTESNTERFIVIELPHAPWNKDAVIPEWRGRGGSVRAHRWVSLQPAKQIQLTPSVIVPYDALMRWVQGRILGQSD